MQGVGKGRGGWAEEVHGNSVLVEADIVTLEILWKS